MKSMFNRGGAWVITAVLCPYQAIAADWSSFDMQYLYSTRFKEPFNDRRVTKRIVTAEYTNAYALGSNYAYVDIAKSSRDELGAVSGEREAPLDFFAEWYHTLSASKLLNTPVTLGPIKDVGLLAGLVAGAKSSEFRPETRAYVLGVEAALSAVTGGFQTLSLSLYDDHSANAFGDVDSRRTYRLAHCFGAPFSIGPLRGKLEGFWKLIGPTFNGGKTQFLAQPQVMIDASPWVNAKPATLFLGVEYQYYRNKYGTDTKESHPQLLVKWYL